MAGESTKGASPVMFRRPLFFYAPDEPPPPAPAPPPSEPPAPTPPAQAVPLDRFNDVISQARTAERERDEARQRLQEIEDAQKSEKERAEAERDRAKAEADQAKSDLAKYRRNTALRNAAVDAGALSPDAIVALANERGVEIDPDKPDTITKAIDAMKGTTEAPGADAALFGEATPATPPTRFGTPATPPPGSTPPANSDDPKLALGQGLLAAIANRR